nr:retrovirus-related Pol polyprotein from transposon TNT 1-94 [Tanacetum cinerariifolium]
MVTKFEIDKFDGKISFAIWKVHMQAVLTHHRYKKALRGIAHKPQSMSDEDWLELDNKALATFQLFLTREVLREVIHKTTAAGLWLKLESLYMTKSLANKLRLKDRLYTYRMKPATELAIAKGDSNSDVYLAIDIEKSRDELIVDSGCTFHIIPHRSWFTTYESFNGGNVYMRNHSICPVIGKGNIQVKIHDDVVRTITRVRHVLDFKRNMISLSTLEANGCKYSGEGGVTKIFKGDLVLMKAIQSGDLYVLQGTIVYGTAGVATSKASLDDSKLWHYRLAHTGEKGMKNLAKKGLIKVSCNLEFCEHCLFGKQKRVSFSPGIHRTRYALDYIHSDLWGSSHVTSRGGKKIKKLRTDNGLEFYGEFNALCRKTIMKKVRCMLSHANFDKDLWVKAATTLSYLVNRSPHRSLDVNIPEILWSGNSVDYSNLRVFRCPVYVHVNEEKLASHAVICIFLGYGSGVKGYRVWCPNPKYRKIIHTKGKVEFEFDVENSTHTQPSFNDEHIETLDDGNMPTSP